MKLSSLPIAILAGSTDANRLRALTDEQWDASLSMKAASMEPPAGDAIAPSSKSAKSKSSKSSCGDDAGREEINVDYLVVGAGIGGLSTAADLSRALKGINSHDSSVAVIEKNDYVGGRIYDVDIKAPSGYDGPPLRAPLGATRTNPSTLPNLRRQMNEYGIQTYCSIFNNRLTARGRSATCGLQNQCNIFGNFCTNEPIFVDDANTGDEPIGAAFIGIPGDDPEGDAIFYILGYETTNPATGVDCDNSNDNPKYQCPRKACESAVDWKSFLQEHLSLEYAELIEAFNYGFFGDFSNSFNACGYLDWNVREYDTLSINCYPEGGLSALPQAMYERAKSNDVEFYLEEPALCVDRAIKDLYEVHTPNYVIRVKKFLFMATNNDEILHQLSGDVIEELRGNPLTTVGKGTETATVSFQWDPEQPAWWYDVIDKAGGTYSFRTYGDLDCFSRLDIIDTPYYRQHNALRVVYSDSLCLNMWKELIEYSEETGDYTKITKRTLQGLKRAYPDTEIPEPVFVKGKFWEAGWYFSAPLSSASHEEVADFAVNPTGDEDDGICLIGDSFGLYYAGWSEAALVTAGNCLLNRFTGELGDALEKIFDEREEIVADYFDTDPGFAAYPGEGTEGKAFPILDNEHFAPFGCLYDDVDGALKEEFQSGQDCGLPACVAQGVPE